LYKYTRRGAPGTKKNASNSEGGATRIKKEKRGSTSILATNLQKLNIICELRKEKKG